MSGDMLSIVLPVHRNEPSMTTIRKISADESVEGEFGAAHA